MTDSTVRPQPLTETASVTIQLDGRTVVADIRPDETVLEAARRAGLVPPSSCEAGNCGTCMALVTDGHVHMRVNDALTDEDLADGYVLTCQSLACTPEVGIEYE